MHAPLEKSKIKASVPSFGLGNGKYQKLKKLSCVDKRQPSQTQGFHPFTQNVFAVSVRDFCMV